MKDNTDSVSLDVLVTGKRQLEAEVRELQDELAKRKHALSSLDSALAWMRGNTTTGLLQDKAEDAPDSAPVQKLAPVHAHQEVHGPRLGNLKQRYSREELENWLMDYAASASGWFTSGDVARWLVATGKVGRMTNYLLHQMGNLLANHPEMFEKSGSGAHTKYKATNG